MSTAALRFERLVPSSGMSAAAARIESVRVEVLKAIRLEPNDRSAVMSEIYTLASQRPPNAPWGAVPMAIELLRLLPSDVALPEPSIEEDGEVAFDWSADKKLLTVSLASTGRVAYAADLEDRPMSDTFQFSNGLPDSFLSAVRAFRKSP